MPTRLRTLNSNGESASVSVRVAVHGHLYSWPRVEATADPELQALKSGDEAAFEALVARYHGPLLRLALNYVRDHGVAEDVVQETWLQVLKSLNRFEGRSSLKTWVYGILINVARARRRRESRLLPFTSLFRREGDGPAVYPDRFNQQGMWTTLPDRWDGVPESRLLSRETLARVSAAIQALPDKQREVIVLRDVAGLGSEEVAGMLDITPANQRVRLHRARAAVRQALEEYLR
jgi:RNA polymerase sigma-70 factor (ECF subfamily)